MYKLRKRKGQYNENDVKKWFEIWDLLFPDRPRPNSPCKCPPDFLDFRILIVVRLATGQIKQMAHHMSLHFCECENQQDCDELSCAAIVLGPSRSAPGTSAPKHK